MLSELDLVRSALEVGRDVAAASKQKITGLNAGLGYLWWVLNVFSPVTFREILAEYTTRSRPDHAIVGLPLEPDQLLAREVYQALDDASKLARLGEKTGASTRGSASDLEVMRFEVIVAAIVRRAWAWANPEDTGVSNLVTRSALDEVEWLIPLIGVHSQAVSSYEPDLCLWLCHYRSSVMSDLDQLTSVPEELLDWKISGVENRSWALVQKDQGVVFWRTVDNLVPQWRSANRGGVVDWGRIYDPSVRQVNKKPLIMIRISTWHPFDISLDRDRVTETIEAKDTWPGELSMRELDPVEVIFFTRSRREQLNEGVQPVSEKRRRYPSTILLLMTGQKPTSTCSHARRWLSDWPTI